MSYIPEPVKRLVRKEAGYGCCVCGRPFIEYHHIVRKSKKPEDIMILCPNHHEPATKGAMLIEEQRKYKNNPNNIERGYVKGQLWINQKVPVINIGRNQLVGEGDFIIIDGERIFSLEINDGKLEVSLKLYDKKNNVVLEVNQNEWISGDPLPWDFEIDYRWLRMRRKIRDISFEIDARKYPIDIRADIWKNGQNIRFDADEIFIDRGKAGLIFQDLAIIGATFEIDTKKKSCTIKRHPRYGFFSLYPHPIIEKRIKLALKHWEEQTCEHDFETIIEKKKGRYVVNKCSKCGKIEKIWKK